MQLKPEQVLIRDKLGFFLGVVNLWYDQSRLHLRHMCSVTCSNTIYAFRVTCVTSYRDPDLQFECILVRRLPSDIL